MYQLNYKFDRLYHDNLIGRYFNIKKKFNILLVATQEVKSGMFQKHNNTKYYIYTHTNTHGRTFKN